MLKRCGHTLLRTHNTRLFSYNIVTPRKYIHTTAVDPQILQRAKTGDLEAQFELGKLYKEGNKELNIEINTEEGIEWLKKAAEQNHKKAQHELGSYYLNKEDHQKAYEMFLKAAKQDYEYSQYNIGLMYHYGIYLPKDIDKAIEYYKLAASKKLPSAQCNLGILYFLKHEEDNHQQQDKARKENYLHLALTNLLLAAKNNIEYAQLHLGKIFQKKGDLKSAISWFKNASDSGNAIAQYHLAIIYWYGLNTEKNHEKAIEYCKLSIANGYVEAETLYSLILSENENTKEESLHYLKSAAEKGSPDAQYLLAKFYIDRNPPDYKSATPWIQKGVKANHPDTLYLMGSLTKKTKPPADTFQWFLKAAKVGNLPAMVDVSNCYFNGSGVDVNNDLALYWLQEAAAKNYSPALTKLGLLYNSGKVVEKDITKASKYFLAATKAGSSTAATELGIISLHTGQGNPMDWFNISMKLGATPDTLFHVASMHEHGSNGVTKDIQKAFLLYSEAANASHPDSLYAVGRLYFMGLGTKRDKKKAIECMKKASNLGHAKAENILPFYLPKKTIYKKKE